MSDCEQAPADGVQTTPAGRPVAKGWLHGCQRISRAATAVPGLRRVWPALSRGMRQFWARRQREELEAEMAGLRVAIDLGEHVEAGVFWYGFPAEDRDALAHLRARLPRDGVAVDIGANIGCFSLALAAAAPEGAVHAFEPVPATADRLAANIARNRLARIRLNRAALGAAPGEIRVWVPEIYWKGRLYNRGRSSRYVGAEESGWEAATAPCLRLDDYAREAGLQRLDVMKLDIEGAELDALEGARETLARFRPAVVMELNAGPLAAAGRSVEAVRAFWREQGYRVGVIAGPRRLRWADGAMGGGAHCNLLCLPAG